MNDLSVLMPMFTVAMGAAILGIRMEPTIAAGRHAGADLLTIDKGKAAQLAVQLKAALAIGTIIYLLATYLFV